MLCCLGVLISLPVSAPDVSGPCLECLLPLRRQMWGKWIEEWGGHPLLCWTEATR